MESNEYGNAAAGHAMRESGSFRSRLERAGNRALAGGTRLGEFEIVGLIDESEVGITYLAYDHANRRDATVWEYMPARLASRGRSGHVAPTHDAGEQGFAAGLAAFLSEARVLSRFDSPFLVRILRFWEANGTGYMAMPFYQGMLLQEAVESGRIQPNEDWIKSLLSHLCEPLDMMHAAHCYHPGIAPGNILLLADGRPLLLDFGAAQRVLGAGGHGPATDMRSGFAAIEEYEDIPNLKQGPWTDIYALAAVAYFLVAGKMPPPAPSRVANDAMPAAQQAGAGRYSAPFLAALDQALAVRPEHRFQSIDAFRRGLGIKPATRQGVPPDRHGPAGAHGGDTSTMRQPGAHAGAGINAPDGRMTRRPPRPRSTAWIAVLAGLLVLIGAGLWTMRRPDQTVVRNEAPVVRGEAPAAPASEGKAEEAPATASASAPSPIHPPAQAPSAPAPSSAAAAPGTTTAPTGATREEAQWLLASSLNNAAAYDAYLRDYPDGRFAPIARAALERIRALADAAPPAPPPAVAAASEEETLWKAVRNIDMPLVYESFLGKYPNGRHAADARARLARLRPAPVPAEPRPLPGQTQQEAGARPFGSGSGSGSRAPGLAAGVGAAPPARPAAEGNAPAPQSPASAPAQPAQAPSDRVALATPAAPAAAPRGEPAGAAQEAESERDAAPEPPLSRTRTLRLPNQIMTGDFTPDPVTGLVSGRGRIIWDNGDQFDGTMVRGQKEGRGEFRWASGQRYSGDWSRDQPNGRGSIQYPNGDRYTGEMRAGLPNGSGTLTFANGNRYRGEVRDGLPNGTGVNRFANGDVYSGAWSRGKAQGQGRYTWANGDYWEGEFSNDAKTDNGRMVSAAAADQPQTGGNAPSRR